MIRARHLLCCALLAACGPRDPQSEALKRLTANGYALSIEEFHRAAAAGDVEALGMFAACGTRIDVPVMAEGKNVTALRVAVRHGHADAVNWLLAQGASVAEADNDPALPLLRLAVASGSEDLARLLLPHPQRAATPLEPLLLESAAAGRNGIMEALLDREPALPLEEALRLAASGGHVAALDLLAQRGARLDDRDLKTGRTALMQAAAGGHADAARLLLTAGAGRFACDHDRQLAADLARQKGHDALADRLWQPPNRQEREIGVPLTDAPSAPPEGWETASAPAIPAPSTTWLDPALPRPLRPLRHAIVGHHSGLTSPPPGRERIELHSVRPAQLPFRLLEIQDGQARIEDLASPNQPRQIAPGQIIGGSGWRLVEIRATASHALPAWLPALAIIEPEGGHGGVALIPGIAARHGPLCAVLHIAGSDEFYEGQAGDVFRFTDSPEAFTLSAIHQRRIEIRDAQGVFHVPLKAN